MKLSFPTALRKMWSGYEVQTWIDDHLENPWKDISSAPKGATTENPHKEVWILGVNAAGEQKTIRWCMEYPKENGCWMYGYSPNNYIDGILEFHPTHWMPLFAPPKKQA
jgi:hypothetical protein